MWRKIISIFTFFIIIGINCCFAESESTFVWSNQSKSITKQTSSTNVEKIENKSDLGLESGSAILIEQNSRANII